MNIINKIFTVICLTLGTLLGLTGLVYFIVKMVER